MTNSLQSPAWHPHFHYLDKSASELFDAFALSYCKHMETRFSMLVTCNVPKQQGRVSAELPSVRSPLIAKILLKLSAKNPPTGFLDHKVATYIMSSRAPDAATIYFIGYQQVPDVGSLTK